MTYLGWTRVPAPTDTKKKNDSHSEYISFSGDAEITNSHADKRDGKL